MDDAFEDIQAFSQVKKNIYLSKLQEIQAQESQNLMEEENQIDDIFIQGTTFNNAWPDFTHSQQSYNRKIAINYEYDEKNLKGILCSIAQDKKQSIIKRIKKFEENVAEQKDLEHNLMFGRILRFENAQNQTQTQGDKKKQFFFDFNENEKPKALNLEQMENEGAYLYPGKIVGIVANVVDSKCIEVKKFINLSSDQQAIEQESTGFKRYQQQQRSDSLVMVIATGPFEKEGKFGYKGLLNLVDKIKRKQISCDILLLMGPIIDENNQENLDKHNLEFEEFFELIMQTIIEEIPKVNIIVVNSTKEINSFHPVPQPPLGIKVEQQKKQKKAQAENLRFVGNPCILEIEDMTIGIINEEVISEINSASARIGNLKENKIDIALKQLLEQKSFVPINPTKFPCDLAKQEYLDFDRCPDVIITPSHFSQSAKLIDQTIFINPQFFQPNLQYAILTFNGNNELGVIHDKIRVDFGRL